MKKLAIAGCVLSTASMLLYAFTGLTLWSPLQPGDMGRVMGLALAHIAPFFALTIAHIE